MEIKSVIRLGEKKLSHISDSPALDAKWLLLHVLGKDMMWLVMHEEQELTEEQSKKFNSLLEERLTGKPLAYIFGQWDFYGRTFVVNEHVLVPRPDTETLIDQSKALIDKMTAQLHRPLVVADIGTGSGCIAITLALELKNIEKIYATDISPEALKIAQKNAAAYGVSDKIVFLEGDMLETLQNISIDLIVSNPPYVPSFELEQTKTSDTIGLTFEPKLALDGGPDGKVFMDKIRRSNIPAVVEGLGGEIYLYNV